MSANHSLLLFEGDVTPFFDEIFGIFGLNMTGGVERATGLAEIWECTNWPRKGKPRHLVHKAALCNGKWTAVLDREMTMLLDTAKCERCAARWNIRIFGYLLESVSGSCVLSLYAPKKVRCLNIQNFEVIENFGPPLPQEEGITVKDMLDDGLMRVSRRLGFADSLFAHPESKVMILSMEDPMRSATDMERTSHLHTPAPLAPHTKKPAGSGNKPEDNPKNKPWWKLW